MHGQSAGEWAGKREDGEKMEVGRNEWGIRGMEMDVGGIKDELSWKEGARDAGGLEWVDLGKKIKAQVVRWTDWKAWGRGRQRRVLLAEYLRRGDRGGGWHELAAKRKYHLWMIKQFGGLLQFPSQMHVPNLCKFNTVYNPVTTPKMERRMKCRRIKMQPFVS